MVPDGSGARLGTVTRNVCRAAAPCASRAVTVTVASPFVTAVTATESPAAETPATRASDETAVKERLSSSGSVK